MSSPGSDTELEGCAAGEATQRLGTEGGLIFGLARGGRFSSLGTEPKVVAGRFYQLIGGHAMMAPFRKEKWGWIESDQFRWCHRGRQSRERLFDECKRRKGVINRLWEEVGNILGEGGLGDERDADRIDTLGSRRGFGYNVREAEATPSNTAVRAPSRNKAHTEAVFSFLRETDAGNVKAGVLAG